MKPGRRGFIVPVLTVLLIGVPQALLAQEKRGAELVVSRKAGYSASGELIAVKEDSLLLLNPAGTDVSIAIDEIRAVSIVRKSKATKGFLTGFLVGGIVGGVAGGAADIGDHKGMNIVYGFLIFGAVGGFVGGVAGSASKREETIVFEGLSEAEKARALNRLRGMARMPDAK